MATNPGFSFSSISSTPDLIFLSYARADRACVEPVAATLRARGASVWYDAGLTAGSSVYVESVRRALGRTGLMLVFVSAASVNSAWVLDELRAYRSLMARESGHKLLAVRLDQTRAPLALADVDVIEPRDGFAETTVNLIINALEDTTLIPAPTNATTLASMPSVTQAPPPPASQEPAAPQPEMSAVAPAEPEPTPITDVESLPFIEATAIAEAASLMDAAPVIIAPALVAPLIEAAPVEPLPVVEPAPEVAPTPMAEPAPEAETAKEAAVAPIAEAVPLAETVPVVEVAPIAEPAPVVAPVAAVPVADSLMMDTAPALKATTPAPEPPPAAEPAVTPPQSETLAELAAKPDTAKQPVTVGWRALVGPVALIVVLLIALLVALWIHAGYPLP